MCYKLFISKNRRRILKTYKILVRFDATDEEDALDFIHDMNSKDWMHHLEEEK